MRSVTAAWSQISGKPSRIVATVIAIVIGVGFACAALVFTSTFQRDLAARVSAPYAGADVVVTPQTDLPSDQLARKIDAVPGVATAVPLYSAGLRYHSTASHGYLSLTSVPAEKQLRWADLVDGDWPSDATQIVVARDAATAGNLPIGTHLMLTDPNGDELPVTVSGIADASASPLSGGQPLAFAPASTFAALHVTWAPTIDVLADPGNDPEQLRAAITEAFPDDLVARTSAQQAQVDVASLTGQTSALTTVLLGFAGIALLVAGIVIANTFTILLTQRRRQIALLRCVGATGAQVRREVVMEAGLIGVAGSLLGAAVGVGVGALAASVTGLDTGGLSVPVVPLAVTVLVGVALTIGAALLPARRAMRVPPLEALRPVATAGAARRSGRVRVSIGAALVLLGGLLLAAGVAMGSLLVAMPGGGISAVGVLLLARSFLPPLLRLVGRIGGAAGVPGRLAAVNAVRNPGRAAATSAALVVGVGLIVMLQVAAASVGASIDKATADRYPVDVSITGDGSPLPADVVSGVHATQGLSGVIDVPGAPATVDLPGASGGPDGSPDTDDEATLVGVPAHAATVLRGGLDALSNSAAANPTVLVPTWWVGAGYVNLGDTIAVTVDGHTQRFTVAVGRLTDSGMTTDSMVTTQAALDALTTRTSTVALWASLADGADAATVSSRLNTLVANDPDLYVTGSAADRASLQSVLGTITTVATGLLAVAVVIAIVGIGNTIGLSVAERTRESALLRALGLRRGQLRLSLALEALLLALIGALVGIVLGLVYGWAGAAATFGNIGRTLVLDVPWGVVALVLLVAVTAGVLASVLPARRAVRAAPVEALAEE